MFQIVKINCFVIFLSFFFFFFFFFLFCFVVVFFCFLISCSENVRFANNSPEFVNKVPAKLVTLVAKGIFFFQDKGLRLN